MSIKQAIEALEEIDQTWELNLPKIRAALAALRSMPAEPISAHIDDDAVDHFAAAMKEKLARARAKGRSGWHECPPADLSRMLREHVEKGDPRDVANFCMFLWSLGKGIATPTTAPVPLTDEQIDAVYREVWSTVTHSKRLSAFARAIERAVLGRGGEQATSPERER